MIVFGTGLYGKVDKVPGLFHVATKFFHIWYLPLVPTQSWIVLAGSEKGNAWRGVEIAMSGKSVLMTYLRTALFLTAAIAGFRALTTHAQDRTQALVSGLLAAAALVVALMTWRGRASHERARELAGILKLDPAAVEQVYGGEPGAESMST